MGFATTSVLVGGRGSEPEAGREEAIQLVSALLSSRPQARVHDRESGGM